MYDSIISDTMKNFLKEEHYEFTDSQKATLIWNAYDKDRKQKLDELTLLMNTTSDKVLRKQIEERINYENVLYERFTDNHDGRYVYVVIDKDDVNRGFFATYDMAAAYIPQYVRIDTYYDNVEYAGDVECDDAECIESMECHDVECVESTECHDVECVDNMDYHDAECTENTDCHENETKKSYKKKSTVSYKYNIYKQLIISNKEDEIIHPKCISSPDFKVKFDEKMPYDGEYVAYFRLDDKGNEVFWWSGEMAAEEEEVVNEFHPDRFEAAFFKIPFFMSAGMCVKDISDGTYGILTQGTEEWQKYMQRIEDRNLRVDYGDIQVMVETLTDEGYWSHMHCNPLHLEIERPPVIPGDKKNKAYMCAMESLSDYYHYNGERNTKELAVKYCREYAAVCADIKREEFMKKAEEFDELTMI